MAGKSEIVEKRLRTTLELNSGNFAKDFKNVNTLLKDNQAEVKNTSKEIKAFGENTKTLTGSLDVLTRQYELQSAKADVYRTGIEKTTKAYETNIEKRKELSDSLSLANKKYDEAVILHGKESDAAKDAAEEVSKLQKEYNKSSKNLETNEKAIKRYNTGLRNTETELKVTKKAIDNTSIALEKSNNKWLQSAQAIEQYKNKVEGIYNSVNSVGNAMIKGGALIATGVAGGLKAYGEFGDSLAKVNSIARVSKDELNNLGDQMRQISNDLVIPINTLAEAEYQALSASVAVGDSMEFLATSSKLAKGGFTDVIKSVDVLSTVLNAYGKETEEAARVSDILITTQNLGKVTVGELADKLGEVIPTAKNAAVNLENVGTSIAVLTSQGVKPAQSITWLNALFNEFSKSGTQVSKVLQEETGKSFAQLASEGKSVSDILLIIDRNSKKTGKSFNDLFGSVEAAKGAMGLLKDEGNTYTQTLEQMEKSAGATEEAFKGIADTDMEKARKAMNELVNSFIKLGAASLPILHEVSGAISALADVISNMDEETILNIANTGKWMLVLGGGIKVVGGLAGALQSILGVSSKVTTAIGSHGGVVGSITALAGGATKAIAAINPLTAILAVLGGGAIYAWSKATEVQKERQEALNRTLQETQDIINKGITPSEIDGYEIEISGLSEQIDDLNTFKEAIKEARFEQAQLYEREYELKNLMVDDAAGSMSAYREELIKVSARMFELDGEIMQLDGSIAVLESDIEKQNGSVQDAEKKLNAYRTAISDAKTQKELLSKATNEHVKELVDEHTAIIKSLRQVEALSDEYEALSAKEKLSADEKSRLADIQKQLIAILGDSIVTYDKEGRAIGINLELLAKEKMANLDLAAAYKKRTILAAAEGKDHIKNVKDQVSKVIQAIKLEEEALIGRDSMFAKQQLSNMQMLPSGRKALENQKKYLNDNLIGLQKYESELDKLLNKVNAIDENIGSGGSSGSSGASGSSSSTGSSSSVQKDLLQEAMDAFEQRKKLNKVTTDNEMYELERIKEKYAKTTDEKISMDEYMLDNYLDMLERKRAAGNMYHEKEIQMLEIARDKYAVTESKKIEIDNIINDKKLENAYKYIDKKKYYNEMSLADEKAAYERMLEYAKNNADETEAIKREIYRVEKEILNQEVDAVKDATDEKIKARQKEYDEQLKLIDRKLSAELDGYQAELDALDKIEEAERRREKEEEHKKKVEDLQGKLTNATTDADRNAIIEQINTENKSYEKYLKDQQRKDERDAIRQKMEDARKKAQIEKNLAEENYNSFVDGITNQQNEYINFLQGKSTGTQATELDITNFLTAEYANRNVLFKNALNTDLAYLQSMATVMKGVYQSIFGLGGFGGMQRPNIPNSGGKTAGPTSNTVNYSPTINATYNVTDVATAKVVTREQEKMLNKTKRNLGL